MGFFGQIGDMYRLQKEAKRIGNELENTHIFAEVGGVKVTVSGKQEIISVEFMDESVLQNAKKLSKSFMEASNKALKKAQLIAAEKMKPLMGNMQM